MNTTPSLGNRGALRPSFHRSSRSVHRKNVKSLRVFSLLNKMGQKQKDPTEDAVIIPLNYAQESESLLDEDCVII